MQVRFENGKKYFEILHTTNVQELEKYLKENNISLEEVRDSIFDYLILEKKQRFTLLTKDELVFLYPKHYEFYEYYWLVFKEMEKNEPDLSQKIWNPALAEKVLANYLLSMFSNVDYSISGLRNKLKTYKIEKANSSKVIKLLTEYAYSQGYSAQEMAKIFGKIIGLNFISKDLLIEQLIYVDNIETIVMALNDYTPKEVEELLLYAQNYLQEKYPSDFALRYQDIKTKMIRYLKRKYNLGPVALVILELLKVESQQQFNQILDDENAINLDYLKKNFKDLIRRIYGYPLAEIKTEEFISRLSGYSLHLKEKRQQLIQEEKDQKMTSKLEIAKAVIDDFSKGDYTSINDFCQRKNISLNTFYSYVEIIKQKSEELSDSYNKKTDEISRKYFYYLVASAKLIIDGLKNGVNDNGETRPFDILDYYEITTVPLSKILQAIKKSKLSGYYNLYINFLRKNGNPRLLTPKMINDILEEKMMVGVVFQNGKIVPGTGSEVTREEKLNVINYLKSKNIPLYDNVYNVALRRYLKGTLKLEADEEKNNSNQK